jgi:hypothetical protein
LAGRQIKVAGAQCCVRIWGSDGSLAFHASVLLRRAALETKVALIGAMAGVKTHPKAQGLGNCELRLRMAVDLFRENMKVALALSVCEATL